MRCRHENSAVSVNLSAADRLPAPNSTLALFYCVFFASAKTLLVRFQAIIKISYWDIIIAALTFTSKPGSSGPGCFFKHLLRFHYVFIY